MTNEQRYYETKKSEATELLNKVPSTCGLAKELRSELESLERNHANAINK